MKKERFYNVLIATAMMLVVSAGFWASLSVFEPESANPASVRPSTPEIGGLVLRETRPLPSFELLDDRGELFRESDFFGKWSFLYFGFTFCPDVCPTSMVEMSRLSRSLSHSHPEVPIQFYLVSVDPARDTPERLHEYVRYFNDSFRGLTGELSELDKLADAASVVYRLPSNVEPGDNYDVGHSSTIVVIDPAGNVRAIFIPPLQAADLANDFAAIEAWY